ncbi:MAG: serine/threonine protein phosphatase [Rhizobiaceae bacterium]|nr:serine/threonine protein phosphatase [Rhizobiaceae bacterium]
MREFELAGSTVSYNEATAPAGVRLYAIGDVHGRLDLLQNMLEQIDNELNRDRPADWRIILLGDYVDRGPNSRGVLQELIARQQQDSRIITLVGNHEYGFLDFLAKPDPTGLFMQFGGIQTAQSYGVVLRRPYAHGIEESDTGFRETSAQLQEAVPTAHVRFLKRQPRGCFAGDYYFCHAGIRPGIAIERQDPNDLIWIRSEFLNYTKLHPKLIVHGHTPVSRPDVRDNRVNIDTRAFDSGVLTAFVAEGKQKRFLTTAS